MVIILAGIVRSFEGLDNASKFCFPAQDERWVPAYQVVWLALVLDADGVVISVMIGTDMQALIVWYPRDVGIRLRTHYWNRSPFLLCLYEYGVPQR